AVFSAVDHFSGPVSRMSKNLDKFNRAGASHGPVSKMSTGFERASGALSRMDQRFSAAKTNMLIAGTAGFLASRKLINAGAEVEQALLAGSSKFGDGVRRNTPVFRELEAAAFELGRTTKFGAVEAAGALNELAASGFEP